MDNIKQNASHLLMAGLVIVAVVILAIDHLIGGAEAYGGILMAGGFSMGGGVYSASSPVGVAVTAAPSKSPGETTAVITPLTDLTTSKATSGGGTTVS